jgi:hypothetical protein
MLADEENGRAVQINGKPASILVPSSSIQQLPFQRRRQHGTHRAKLRDAIEANSP